MRLVSLFSIILLLSVAVPTGGQAENPDAAREPNAWRSSPVNWKGELRLEKSSFKVGEKIPLHLITRNISKSSQLLVVTYPFKDYWVEIKTADGKAAPYAQLAKNLRIGASSSTRMPLIGAGGEWNADMDLVQYFQLTTPGRYTIFARRHYSWAGIEANGKITPDESPSDPKPITFTITP